jgi:hypothetical protein
VLVVYGDLRMLTYDQELLFKKLNDIFTEEVPIYSLLKEQSFDINQQNDKYFSYINLPKFIPETHNVADYSIPRIMHYVWFTNENNPKEIPEDRLANLKFELDKLPEYNMNSPEPWKVKVWVNCKPCMVTSLEKISDMEYPVEIVEWQSEDFGNSRSYLQNMVTNFTPVKNSRGIAIDIGRQMMAEKYGGFILDFDYNTGNSTEIIVQHGYHSITHNENNYAGFIPQHKVLVDLHDYISSLFQIIEKYDFNSQLQILNPNTMVNIFGYGPFLSFMERFLTKEDLSVTPDCTICDVDVEENVNSFFLKDSIPDEGGLCSIDVPEICLVADYQLINGVCLLVMQDGGIDFGFDQHIPPDYSGSTSSGGSWK